MYYLVAEIEGELRVWSRATIDATDTIRSWEHKQSILWEFIEDEEQEMQDRADSMRPIMPTIEPCHYTVMVHCGLLPEEES